MVRGCSVIAKLARVRFSTAAEYDVVRPTTVACRDGDHDGEIGDRVEIAVVGQHHSRARAGPLAAARRVELDAHHRSITVVRKPAALWSVVLAPERAASSRFQQLNVAPEAAGDLLLTLTQGQGWRLTP